MKTYDEKKYYDFIRFLKNNNAYRRFFKNYNSQNNQPLKKYLDSLENDGTMDLYRKMTILNRTRSDFQIILGTSFKWYYTKEGRNYWKYIYNTDSKNGALIP